jgi:hypothetical protein
VEIQGEMKARATNVPGVQICEHLPNVAQVMDRVTVVRSMSHPYAEHGVAYALSGIPTYTPALETRPRDARQWPFIGSVVDYLEEQRTKVPIPPVPRNIGLPWMLSSKTDFPIVNAGPFAAFLGQAYDPVWAHFNGKGTRLVPKYGEGQKQQYEDPFGGVSAAGRFQLSLEGQRTGGDVAIERIDLRRSLLEQFDRARRAGDRNEATLGRHSTSAASRWLCGKATA